jgi:hypothetical protein
MNRLFAIGFFFLLWLCSFAAQAQQQEMIRIRGIVIDGESLQNIPDVNITVKNHLRSTHTNESGVFSLYAFPSDTLLFSNVGYTTAQFIVPEDMELESYTFIQRLYRDTLMLEAQEVTPFPVDFEEAFMALDTLSDPVKELNERYDSLYHARYDQDKFYYEKRYYFVRRDIIRVHNQLPYMPPNHWFEPWRWGAYFRSLKQGDFKNKEPITDQYFYRRPWIKEK